MKYFSFLIPILLLIVIPSSSIFAAPGTGQQDSLIIVDKSDEELSLIGNIAQVDLTGNVEVFKSAIGLGFEHTIAPKTGIRGGIHLMPFFFHSKGNTVFATTFFFNFKISKRLGIGWGYKFWSSDVGWFKKDLENSFFALTWRINK